MATKKLELNRLFPPEVVAERKAILNRFWSGADLGRPVVLARCNKKCYVRSFEPEKSFAEFAASLEVESKVPWDTVRQFHNLRGLDTQYPYSHPDKVFAEFPGVVHSMTLDYAENQRNFSKCGPDAFLNFLLEHTPRHIRWQMFGDADDLPGLKRQMDIVQSRWS